MRCLWTLAWFFILQATKVTPVDAQSRWFDNSSVDSLVLLACIPLEQSCCPLSCLLFVDNNLTDCRDWR